MIPALVGVLLVVFLLSKHWRLAAFTLFVICVESGTYRATSLVVHRDRPDVHRLESLPVNASYPSGHTAASVALFGGLLIVLASRIENRAVRIMLWSLVVAIPVFVIWSRMLRGMHHITDVTAGVLMGIAALCITIFAARAAGAAAAQRDAAETSISARRPKGRHEEGCGDRPRRQDDRRRARGAALDAREAGVDEPIWSEVPKSKYAPERVQRALDEGAELVFVWGGDGMVQRSIDTLAGSGVTLAIIPAGTANLFASSLEIPSDIAEGGRDRAQRRDRMLDVGKINGERFAVMAGAGLDAHMIHDADGGLKDRFGRLAYIWTASKNIRAEPFKAQIDINDELWYKGTASCVLLGNVGSLFGGIEAFDNARPDDGLLEVGVTNAEGIGQWARTVARTAIGSTAKSPFVQVTKAKKIRIELDRKVAYELDGGDRDPVKVLKAKIEPGAITVRVPHPE